VPGGTTAATLQRLSSALAATGAGRIVFLGDLLHAAPARAAPTRGAVARWRAAHRRLALTLVRGNHDDHAGDPPPEWEVECVDGPMALGELALAHQPDPVPGRYVLAGHVHPGAIVTGRAHDRLRLPSFHFGAQVGVLPAFGDFTGLHVLPRSAGDRVFVIAGDAVRALAA
jgi:DNA ligase-associated metallophosphoesterase